MLLEGIDEDAVDWRDNYSGDQQEPVVLPAAAPNLLANGAQGIAVGMATSVPPHNVAELLDASLYLIAHPDASVDALINFVPGPDFPTGGVLVDSREAIAEVYRTGRGGFRLRARWTKEETGRGGWVAVVTEIPYGVQKSRLIEALAELVNQKKAPLLADVRDESAEDVRIVLEPRARTVEPAVMMEQLFKLSELEVAHLRQYERAGRRHHAARGLARAKPCSNGSTIAARCCCAARGIGWRRSSAGSNCSPA